jgi:ribosome maturation factor RimP
MLTAKLEELLKQKFEEEEYQHLFVVEVKHLPGDKINVFIDSDTGLQLDHCATISRFLESEIEENGWLGEKYTLDVSSPGVDNPLKLKRQYHKNIGREVSVELEDTHKHIKGVLTEVNDEFITVELEEKVRLEGKKKKEWVTTRHEVPFDQIKKTIVKISF